MLKRLGEWGLMLLMVVGVLFLLGQAQSSTVFLTGEISTGVGRAAQLDDSTHAIETIDFDHSEGHAGDGFIASHIATGLNDGNSFEYLIETGNTTTWVHMVFKVQGSLDTEFEIYETTTKTTNTAMTEWNRNRNSATAATVVVTHTPGGAGDGNLMYEERFGNDGGPGAIGGEIGTSRGAHEWVMKQNEKYLVKITSHSDANFVSTIFSWYEHTDKD